MKHMARIGIILLCLCLLGCVHAPGEETTVPTTAMQPRVDAAALYADAIAPVSNARQLAYQVSITRQTTVGKETFTENTQQDIILQAGKCSVTEKATYGSYTTDIAEIYADGTVYATVSGSNFSSEMTREEFISRYAPAALLDAALYSTVTASDDCLTITFSDPTGAEAWAADASATVISAAGTVKLDGEGNLLSSTYELTYTVGAATVSSTTTVTLSSPDDAAIEAPADISGYIFPANVDGVRMIERAYGYLLQSDYVTSTAQTSIMSQAVGMVRTQQSSIDTYDDMLSVSQAVSQTNYSTGGDTSTETISELFRNGKYTSSVNGEASTENADVTIDIMRNHCRELLTSNLPELSYVTDVACEDLGSLYLISMTGSDDLGQAYCNELNYTLFQNESFLNDLATSYSTDALGFYLAVDKYTYLPTASGISYSGSHTINDVGYLLTMQTDQSYDLASLSSYESITGQSAPDTQPEAAATPLFYRVTGQGGEEMWLLGTIHAGDDRTAYLPQQITDAFQNADALAVEFDTETFADRLNTDAELQAVIAEAYYHPDGLSAHLSDPSLHKNAEDLMKATGSYNYNTPYLRAAFWSNAIENFYLRQGYRLSADKGMDTRLLKQAHQLEKTVLEIESGEAQIQMKAKWSDALQELLLKVTIDTDAREYADDIAQLYELWCRGDEAALTEAIKEDLSDLTDTEKLLYEEYNHSMFTSRNALMLDAARTYLESGDTVFYAVGLAHLLGEDGLVSTLRDAGYTVTQVTYE